MPERPAAETNVEKGGDRVNRDRPHDSDENKGNIKPFGGPLVLIAAIEQIAADVNIEDEVTVQHDHVPAQHRGRKIELTDSGNQVPEAIGPAQIHRDEREAHNDGRDREQLAKDDEIMQLLVVVNVNGDDHHHGRCGDAHQESEVRDVNSPRNFITHPGDKQSVYELLRVGIDAEQDENGEDAHPRVVAPVAHERDARTAGEKKEIIANGLLHTSK